MRLCVLMLLACGPVSPKPTPLQPTDCTLSATVEEALSSGMKVGVGRGSLRCPSDADLELTVCLQSALASTFSDALCVSTSLSGATSVARSAEANFPGTRDVRTVSRGRVNGADLAEQTSNVISIVK